MLKRLGLAGRLVMILLLVLVTLGLSGIGISWYLRGLDAGTGVRLPLPDQVAAIVEVLETAGPVRRDLVLRAVNAEDLRVTVDSKRPGGNVGRRFPVAEWLVGQYLQATSNRDIEVTSEQANSRFAQWIGLLSPNARLPLRIVVPMSGGEFAIFETRGPPTQRIFGVPTGFWIGVLGALLGLFAIIAIVREAKPLGELALSVSKFSGDRPPEFVKARGAPDVRALIDAVNAMHQRIVALIKGRTVLLGAVSHDLKTYITRLRLRVEEVPDAVQRDKAIRDLDDMATLIEGAIAVARGSPASGLREPFDPAMLIVEEIEARGAETRVRMNCLVRQPVEMIGDKLGLRRCMGNLIDNALRYATHCEISVAGDRTHVQVRVEDDGPGIPEAERAAVLEPFYRLEPSRSRATGGSGLGLAIVKQIVEGHGGTIEITQSKLGGACVDLICRRSDNFQLILRT